MPKYFWFHSRTPEYTEWTYVNGTPKECQYTCKEGYHVSNNKCVKNIDVEPPKCILNQLFKDFTDANLGSQFCNQKKDKASCLRSVVGGTEVIGGEH